jgi:hypothetical protein
MVLAAYTNLPPRGVEKIDVELSNTGPGLNTVMGSLESGNAALIALNRNVENKLAGTRRCIWSKALLPLTTRVLSPSRV